MSQLRKFPRTPHLAGSRLQPGDEDLRVIPLTALRGQHLVITEKLDGANAGVSFDAQGNLRLQSRGHFLAGGPRERHFDLFKTWAATCRDALFATLGRRYVLYGEWLYAKHTIFYDALPHYFLAFDVLDTEQDEFLATSHMDELLDGLPLACAPRLWKGPYESAGRLPVLIATSHIKTRRWRERLLEVGQRTGVPRCTIERETDPGDAMEGLYIKAERGGRVEARYKLVRETFRAAVDQSGAHWLERPIVPNQLRAGVDLFTAP